MRCDYLYQRDCLKAISTVCSFAVKYLSFDVWGAAVLPDQSLAGASSLSEITAKPGLASE